MAVDNRAVRSTRVELSVAAFRRLFRLRGNGYDLLVQSMQWSRTSLQRLLDGANEDGSWGYRSASRGSSEPTAWACLALALRGVESQRCIQGLDWLASMQEEDGGVPVLQEPGMPRWPTAQALIAWFHAPDDAGDKYVTPIEKAAQWLLDNGGLRLPRRPSIYGHDTMLQGWAWVAETHSWVEPTSYAVLALRAAEQSNHARVREGVALLLDRAISTGGWNYGNTRVLENTLRPFPATTGIALAALANEPRDERIDSAIAYLQSALPLANSALSVAWGVIGLTAWSARPTGADMLLAQSVEGGGQAGFGMLIDALALMADSGWSGD